MATLCKTNRILKYNIFPLSNIITDQLCDNNPLTLNVPQCRSLK